MELLIIPLGLRLSAPNRARQLVLLLCKYPLACNLKNILCLVDSKDSTLSEWATLAPYPKDEREHKIVLCGHKCPPRGMPQYIDTVVSNLGPSG